jgi:hypothetical protein
LFLESAADRVRTAPKHNLTRHSMRRLYLSVCARVIRESGLCNFKGLPVLRSAASVPKQYRRIALDHWAANANMRKRLIYKSVSGNPLLNGDSVELNFITDPVLSADDVTVEMSRSELERLHRRISDRLSQQKQS